MAYEIGAATDFKNLLVKLKTFVSTSADLIAAGQQWTILRDDVSGINHELILKGPGYSGDDEILVSITTEEDDTNDYHNWILDGFYSYDQDVATDQQPGKIKKGYEPLLSLWNNPIDYWITANGARIVLVAKVSSVYISMYLGFFEPYATPSEYPYPLVVAGNIASNLTGSSRRWSTTVSYNRGVHNPGAQSDSFDNTKASFYFRSAAGIWTPVANNYSNGYTTRMYHTRPFRTFSDGRRITNAAGGIAAMFPVEFSYTEKSDFFNILGSLRGLFCAPSLSATPESFEDFTGGKYVYFPDIFRSGLHEMFLLRLD